MSVSKTEEEKCCDIQVMKDAGYGNKLCYITVLYYSLWNSPLHSAIAEAVAVKAVTQAFCSSQ